MKKIGKIIGIIFFLILINILSTGNVSYADCSHWAVQHPEATWENRSYDSTGHWLDCSKCGAVLYKSPHSWQGDVVEVYRETTCEVGGEWLERCNGCAWTRLRTSTTGKGHTFSAATCVSPKTCVDCGATEGSALGHLPGTTYYSNAELHWNICSRCNAAANVEIHTNTAVANKAATCTEAGNETRTCTLCGYSAVAEVAPLGHKVGSNYTYDANNHWKNCERCGIVQNNAAHDYTSSVTKKPTCTETGTREYSCIICSRSYTESIAALGHQENTSYNMNDSQHWKTCLNCNAEIGNKRGNHTDSNGDGACDVCGFSSIVLTKEFTISPKGLTLEWRNTNFAYDGGEKQPTATANSGVTGETVNIDVIGTGVDSGTYTAKATIHSVVGGRARIENYTILNPTQQYKIGNVSMSLGNITLDVNEYTYDGTAHEPTPTMMIDDVVVKPKDYTISYSNNINAGTATVTLTGVGNYNGTLSKTFTIKPKPITLTWENKTDFGYTGLEQAPKVSADSGVVPEVLVIDRTTNIEVGSYTTTATLTKVNGGQALTSNYTLTNPTKSYQIIMNEIVGAVRVIGENGYGKILFANTSGISPSDCTFTYQWYKNTTASTSGGTAITGETSSSYLVTSDMIGYYIYLQVVASKSNYNSKTFYALADGVVTLGTRYSTVTMNDYFYDGTLSTPSIDNDEESPVVTYYYNTTGVNTGGIKWSTVTSADKLDVGTYYMYAVIEQTEHYQKITTEVTEFHVLKGKSKEPTVEDKIYNGTMQAGVYGERGISISGTPSAIDVGDYIAYGTVMSNYEVGDLPNPREYHWKMLPCDVSSSDISITLTPKTFEYDGTPHEPAVTVKLNGQTLVQGRDYQVVYQNNVNVGKGEAIISGINNFSGTTTELFNITASNFGNIELENNVYAFTGDEVKAPVKVYDKVGKLLEENKDYILTYHDNVLAGKARVVITGIGNFKGEEEKEFIIISEAITSAVITLSGMPYTYDGTEKCPTAIVNVNGKTLRDGIDYKVTYKNNVNAGEGTAIAIIEGKGSYSGRIEKNFTIMKAYRKARILPGKALVLGQTGELTYSYEGDIATTTLVIDDGSIASATTKEYSNRDSVVLTALKAGKSTLSLTVAETQNYHELKMISEVLVFATAEEAYPLYGSVIINDDDEYTNNPNTMLTLSADFSEYMYISESNVEPAADADGWYEFSYKMPYKFSAAEGVKNIYVWFKDDQGKISGMATDAIELKYEATLPGKVNNIVAYDNALLDQTNLDKQAPEINYYEYHNRTIDIEVIFKQKDVLNNDVRSGIDHETIKYGYREAGEGMANDQYIWQDTPVIVGLKYDKDYAFVTQAYDRAGNGYLVSDETMISVERKFETKITLEDLNVPYNGQKAEIKPATFDLVDGTPITGNVTYYYYVDKACTTLTTTTRDGSAKEGGAPSMPGIYYVQVELEGDHVYYDNVSNIAELRIGWDISKGAGDEVFAYIERTNPDSDEFILNIIGKGEMDALDTLISGASSNKEAYWEEYKDKIIELNIHNDADNAITNIGDDIFKELTKIPEIVLPDTIVEIGDGAFSGCEGVTEIIMIPISVEKIGSNPFDHVNAPGFDVAYGNKDFAVIDGVLVNSEHTELISYPSGKTDEKYTIPDEIKVIKEGAFAGNDYLKDVVIPNGVETIEGKAFHDCQNLEVVEIEDLMAPDDHILDLKSVQNDAFTEIANGSIIYTFSEDVAKKFEKEITHYGADTEVYYPPVITLQPIDMNGDVGYQVKFMVEAKAGYPTTTNYQWFKVKDGVESVITGATETNYATPSLVADNHNEKYYCRVYNAQYYYDRGYVNSNQATLSMITAHYIVERENYNTYLFETLQDSFDFAIQDDVVKPLHNVSNEPRAILESGQSIKLDADGYTITLAESIEIEGGSKLEIVGNGTIAKTGNYVIKNRGELVLNGGFSLSNLTGFGIQNMENSELTYTSGSIYADRNAIYAEDASVVINGENANVVAETSEAVAAAVIINGMSNLSMTNGNIKISYKAEPASGSIYGIYLDGESTIKANISGGSVKATSTAKLADAIANSGKSDLYISGTANLEGSRYGIANLPSNLYGDVTVEGGIVKGGICGIFNHSQAARVVIGQKGNGVSTTVPVIIGGEISIMNTNEKNTLELYDGVLYSHGSSIICEQVNNITGVIGTYGEILYTETGRNRYITEEKYSLYVEENATYSGISGYHAAYLKENKIATLTGPKLDPIEPGSQTTLEVIASGGHPDVYNFEWQISTDGGRTWSKVSNGVGGDTSKYTTPIITGTMDGYQYRCKVSNAAGDIYSNVVTVIIVSNEDLLSQRPVGRIIFTNGKEVEFDGTKKYTSMQMIVKTVAELKTLELNGESIISTTSAGVTTAKAEFELADGSVSGKQAVGSPIKIEKTVIGSETQVVEYTYTYDLKVYQNGILTIKMVDKKDRDNVATQTVDVFYELKVSYYLSQLTETKDYMTVTFYANKPVKPVSSVVNSYSNNRYLDLVSVDGGEYSYRYSLDLDTALPTTIFKFEDEFKNEAYVTVNEITRVKYRKIKFNSDGTSQIDDLNILEAYDMAQDLENTIEVNRNEEIQNRYGLNTVQSDVFMSRARDIGSVEILGQATTAKSYDGIFTKNLISSGVTDDQAYDYVESSENTFVAAAAKTVVENEFSVKDGKYVDILSKALDLYKGMKLNGFRVDDTTPYMYTDINGATNIAEDTTADASFRATIIGK